jgi:hypothetical protein
MEAGPIGAVAVAFPDRGDFGGPLRVIAILQGTDDVRAGHASQLRLECADFVGEADAG